MNGSPFGSAHQDVLSQTPTDADSKARLVEEIRSRAKMAFARKDMPVCDALCGPGAPAPDAAAPHGGPQVLQGARGAAGRAALQRVAAPRSSAGVEMVSRDSSE